MHPVTIADQGLSIARGNIENRLGYCCTKKKMGRSGTAEALQLRADQYVKKLHMLR